jgi:hypothetical protein
MTQKEFEETLLEKLTLSFHRNLPSGGKIEFYIDPDKYHEEATEEKKAFWAETRAWISGNGKFPESAAFDYIRSFQDAVSDGLYETKELRKIALRLLTDLSQMEGFKSALMYAGDLKDMGWSFEQYLEGSLKEDTPGSRTTVPEDFGKDAVEVYPKEAAAWAKEALAGEAVDTDSPYLRAIYCALNFLLLDSKKYAVFQEIIDRYVQESFTGYLKNPEYKPKKYALADLINDYQSASANIPKIVGQLSKIQKTDLGV